MTSEGAQQYEIEILRAGNHTASSGESVALSTNDLKEIADSYNPQNFRAPLIVSHDTQGLSDRQLPDSEFAFGIPQALKVVGDRLKATFEEIAPEFVQWVRDKKILAISGSIYPRNSSGNPTPGKLSLRHIAGLGRTPPAIKGMTPLNLSEDSEYWSFCSPMKTSAEVRLFRGIRDFLISEYDIETADSIIPNYLLEMLEEEEESEYPMSNNFEEKLKAREAAIAAKEAELATKEAALLRAANTEFCESRKQEGKLRPTEVGEVVEFMSALSEEPQDFAEGKKLSPIDWFKNFLTNRPPLVEFKEIAKGAATNSTQSPDEIAKKAGELVEAKKQQGIAMSFSEAVHEVMKVK